MKTNSIFYLGDISNLHVPIDELKVVFDAKVQHQTFNDDFQDLFKKLCKLRPKVLIIEAFNISSDFLSFLLLLKEHSSTKETKIVCIFPDKDNLSLYSDIYAFGVEYGLVTGEEKEKLISDIGLFIDPIKFRPTQYAMASGLKVPSPVYFQGKISSFTAEKINIESALNLNPGDKIEAFFNLHKNMNCKYYKVEEKNCFIPKSYFKHTYGLKILFPGDEDLNSEIVGEMTTKEQFSRIFNGFRQSEFTRNDHALIIDSRVETISELVFELNKSNKFVKLANSYLQFEEQLKLFRPQIICYQMQVVPSDASDEEKLNYNGVESFNRLIQSIKSTIDYTPYIIVFNDRSRSEAYRKAYSYEQLLTNTSSFELKYLNILMDNLQKHYEVKLDTVYLSPPNKNTIFEIQDEIIITSLSENKMTFYYKGELDEFTTLRIGRPLNIYLTVVKLPEELPAEGDLKQYFAIISNTNEKEKMEIRRLVNILMKLELEAGEEFVLKSVKDLQEDIIQKKVKELIEFRKIERKKYLEAEGNDEND